MALIAVDTSAPPAQLSVKRLQLGGASRVNEVRINPITFRAAGIRLKNVPVGTVRLVALALAFEQVRERVHLRCANEKTLCCPQSVSRSSESRCRRLQKFLDARLLFRPALTSFVDVALRSALAWHNALVAKVGRDHLAPLEQLVLVKIRDHVFTEKIRKLKRDS